MLWLRTAGLLSQPQTYRARYTRPKKKTGQRMSKYDDLPREQLIELLKKRDRTKKLGLNRPGFTGE